MPKKVSRRCRHRGTSKLDLMVEKDLCFGYAWVWELPLKRYLEEWKAHRHILLPNWIQCYPGSRPAACYVAQEIPGWAWKCRLKVQRHPLRPELGQDIDMVAHRHGPELDHLESLGILSPEEIALARERMKVEDGCCYTRYRKLGQA